MDNHQLYVEKFDYYDYDDPEYLDTERSNHTSRKPATYRTLTNRSGYIENDYDSEEDRRPLRLAPLNLKQSPRRKPLNVDNFRRPIVFNDNEADDDSERQRRQPKANKPGRMTQRDEPRGYDDEDDDERYRVEHVHVVKKKPHRKKVVIYHTFNDDGEEIGEPEYEVTYADEDLYVEPKKGKSRNKKPAYND
jgi:hypothetical protein